MSPRKPLVQSALLLMGGLFAVFTFLKFKADGLGTPGYHGLNSTDVQVLAMAVLYVGMVITIRWQMIAQPIHSQMEARLKTLEVELGPDHSDATGQAVAALMAEARALIASPRLTDVLFWSRGRETAGWQLIDQADQRMVQTWTSERLRARLPVMAKRLATLGAPEMTALSAEIDQALAAPEPSLTLLRELTLQGMDLERGLLREQDLAVDYHNNKLAWYILISVLALVMIADFLPEISATAKPSRTDSLTWLVGGAVGGVLSRITRAVRSDFTSHELGLRWMALFLSPLLGALAGWAGLVLIDFGQQVKLFTIGTGALTSHTALGLAIVLGVSERFFTDLASQVEGKVGQSPAQDNPGAP